MADTDNFAATLKDASDMALVKLQHDLRRFPEDKAFIDLVLKELGRRQAPRV